MGRRDLYYACKGMHDGIVGGLIMLMLFVFIFVGLPQLATYIRNHPANPCDDPWLEHPSGFRGVPVSFGKLKSNEQIRVCYENLNKK